MKKIVALVFAGVIVGLVIGRFLPIQNPLSSDKGRAGFPPSSYRRGLKPLKILNLKFDNVSVSFAPHEKPNPPDFSKEDTIQISYELSELVALRIGDKKGDAVPTRSKKESIIHMRQDLMIRDKKGNILIVKPSLIEVKRNLSDKPARFINEISLKKIPNVPKGKYEIGILVTDLVGFQTAEGCLWFEIR